MKKLFALVLMAAVLLPATAQNVYKIKDLIKKQQYAEIEADVQRGFENPKWQDKNDKQAMLWNAKAEIELNQYFNPILALAAQSQPFDTLAFCNHLETAVDAFLKSNELDEKHEYAVNNKFRLMQMLDYFNYAGFFCSQIKDTERSIKYFQKYLDMPAYPVFTQQETDSIYASKKEAYDQTRFNLAFLYYQAKDWKKLIEEADICLQGDENTMDLYTMKQQACLEMGDSAAWYETMQKAILRTNSLQFQQALLYDYISTGKTEEAKKMADDIVARAPEKAMSWYMKGCVKMNIERDFVGCRESFEKTLAIDPTFVDAHINLGNSYINEVYNIIQSGKYKYVGTSRAVTGKEGAEYNRNKAIYDAELAEVRGYYEKALPHMEAARAAQPDEPKKWANALQMIYQNLGRKEDADAMQQYIDQANGIL